MDRLIIDLKSYKSSIFLTIPIGWLPHCRRYSVITLQSKSSWSLLEGHIQRDMWNDISICIHSKMMESLYLQKWLLIMKMSQWKEQVFSNIQASGNKRWYAEWVFYPWRKTNHSCWWGKRISFLLIPSPKCWFSVCLESLVGLNWNLFRLISWLPRFRDDQMADWSTVTLVPWMRFGSCPLIRASHWSKFLCRPAKSRVEKGALTNDTPETLDGVVRVRT